MWLVSNRESKFSRSLKSHFIPFLYSMRHWSISYCMMMSNTYIVMLSLLYCPVLCAISVVASHDIFNDKVLFLSNTHYTHFNNGWHQIFHSLTFSVNTTYLRKVYASLSSESPISLIPFLGNTTFRHMPFNICQFAIVSSPYAPVHHMRQFTIGHALKRALIVSCAHSPAGLG